MYSSDDCDHNWFSHHFQMNDRIGNREQVSMQRRRRRKKQIKCAMWNVPHETYPTIGVESFNQLALHLGAKLWNILKFHFLYLVHSYEKKL